MATWEFEQIGGPTTLTLSGYAAPFGRPRKKPVAREIVKSRVQTTNYPGKRGPTRHSFKTMYEPMELEGRWMTKTLARGQTANELADLVGALIHDELPCRISWGNIVSYIGYLEELELGRESEHEIAWKLKILIDGRDADENDNPRPTSVSIPEQLQEIDFMWPKVKLKTPGDLLNDVLGVADQFNDKIDGFIAELKSPLATLNKISRALTEISKIADRVGSLPADATRIHLTTLQHLRSVTQQVHTTLNNVVNTVLNTPIEVALAIRTAKDDVNYVRYQIELDTTSNIILATIAVMERTAQLQQQQEITGSITARANETWESLSTRAVGNASQAGRIRQLNGGGGHAQGGEDYVY